MKISHIILTAMLSAMLFSSYPAVASSHKRKSLHRHKVSRSVLHHASSVSRRGTATPKKTTPDGQYGALVALGEKIFNDTPRYAGQYAGNALSCANCHLDGGRKPDAAPMWGAVGMYPRYQGKSHQVVTFEQRLQQCFIFSEHGYAPALNSQTILALSAYSHYLAKGRALGVVQKGAGFAALPTTNHDGDPVAGRHVYKVSCMSCHGVAGNGKVSNGKVIFPPLWGLKSFTRGAGMSRPAVAARFIWKNMPLGNANLSPQQAKDVAAFIDIQMRSPDPRKGLLGWIK